MYTHIGYMVFCCKFFFLLWYLIDGSKLWGVRNSLTNVSELILRSTKTLKFSQIILAAFLSHTDIDPAPDKHVRFLRWCLI